MPTEEAPRKQKSNLRLWLAIVTAIGGAVAIVPPTITAMRASPAVSQAGSGNSAILGSTVGSNNQTTNNYWSMWVAGAKTILGESPKPQEPQVPAPVSPLKSEMPQTAVSEPKEPEPGAVGRLVVNASMLNEATWSPEQSKVTRLLTFVLRAEATSADDKAGTMDATLSRDGKDLCTLSLNNKTSPVASGVHWGASTCYDTLPANAIATYKTRVKPVNMNPLVVRLDLVDAVRK